MIYIYFLLHDDNDGRFSVEELYTEEEASKLPKDMIWVFTEAQLHLLYGLLRPYYRSSGFYYYRSIEALMELTLCQNADEILTLLSWSNN